MRLARTGMGFTALAVIVSLVGANVLIFASGTAMASGRIAWARNFSQARRISSATGKPMLIVIGAKWCGFCRKLESTTLSNRRMAAYINASFVPLHLDSDRDSKAAQNLKVTTLPATFVLAPDRRILARIDGYRDVGAFYDELQRSLQ